MFWTAPETQLGDAIRIVSCNDVIFVVGTKGLQRIHGTAVSFVLKIIDNEFSSFEGLDCSPDALKKSKS